MTVHPHPPAPPPPRTSPRPWAVTAIAWLLLVELGGLAALAVFNIARPVVALAGLVLGLLALVAAIGFARLRRGGWVNAVLVQGGVLALALYLDFRSHPMYADIMMVYGIIMVLYLHQADVQAAFRLAPGPEPGPP